MWSRRIQFQQNQKLLHRKPLHQSRRYLLPRSHSRLLRQIFLHRQSLQRLKSQRSLLHLKGNGRVSQAAGRVSQAVSDPGASALKVRARVAGRDSQAVSDLGASALKVRARVAGRDSQVASDPGVNALRVRGRAAGKDSQAASDPAASVLRVRAVSSRVQMDRGSDHVQKARASDQEAKATRCRRR